MPKQRARDFLSTRKTLVMATVSADGTPTVSYAPFVHHENAFYIYTSGLSRHTHDLEETKRVSIMCIEDEAQLPNLFARKRLTFPCDVNVIPKDDTSRTAIMELFAQKFGTIFALILPLGDFVLFQLKPLEGTYVEGFGQAYRIDADLLSAVRIGGPNGSSKKPPSMTAKKPRKSK